MSRVLTDNRGDAAMTDVDETLNRIEAHITYLAGGCEDGCPMPDDPEVEAKMLRELVRALRQAAYRSGLEAAAKIPDEWLKHPSCEPGEVCTHIRMATEIAGRIRSLAAKENSK